MPGAVVRSLVTGRYDADRCAQTNIKYILILIYISTEIFILKSEFFRVMAHPTRIRILEQLVHGERTVQELQAALTLDQPIVSAAPRRAARAPCRAARRQGAQAYYMLRSPLIADVLGLSREFLNRQLPESRSLLRELRREGRRA
jgi:ArsR family transcriptional regulator